jgi:hypothetical protein
MSRRRFLFLLAGASVGLVSACVQAPRRGASLTAPATTPELDGWRAQANALLADGLQTLRTFESFAAYRASVTAASDRRSGAELVWDPPTGAEWDAATRVAHGLRGRADQLFQAITRTQVDLSVWREQREMADVVGDVGGVGDALGAYRDRLDALRPGDAAGALSLLDDAWSKWDRTAERLGLARSEAIDCAA